MLSPLLVACSLAVQSPAPPQRLEGEALERAVDELARLVEERYVFADVGKAIGERLRQRLWEGAYETPDLDALAARLTADLRSVNDDRHLGVHRLPPRAGGEPSPEELRRNAAEERRSNHGFQKLEILDGNVGYLDLRGFRDAGTETERTEAGETAAAALRFFANADALVIDLRQNGGGHPSMIQLLLSYFFAEPTLINTFEWRGREEREEYWTYAEVPGPRLTELPLYVLTSSATFSAAEEFAYDVKCLGRATLVGARTGGGAHPGGTHPFADGALAVFVPNGRAINPYTDTNWEGTGVEPDVEVPAERALEVALAKARARLRAGAGAAPAR
jgi:hypothetical protein